MRLSSWIVKGLAIFPYVPLCWAQPPMCSKLITRKEWRTLGSSEKAQWVSAVKCLANIRHERLSLTRNQTSLQGERSLYDDFSYSHAMMEHSAHNNAYFLPWHRWFLHLFDRALRETCGYNGTTPYWDWSIDHSDLIHSTVFEDSSEYGLGGTGDCQSYPGADCIVTTGAFAPSSKGSFELSWPVAHPLRRNLSLITGWFAHEQPQNSTLGPQSIRNATQQTTGDFFRFQHRMTLMHNHVHNFVGGDMAGDCPKVVPKEDCSGMAENFTPNDPLFWLHHAQLDRLWNEWQRRDPANFGAFSGVPLHAQNTTFALYDLEAHVDHRMSFDVHSTPVAPRWVLDTGRWPLCYEYASCDRQVPQEGEYGS